MRSFRYILLWFECFRRAAAEEEAHLRSSDGRRGASGPRPDQDSEPARGRGPSFAHGQRKPGRRRSEPGFWPLRALANLCARLARLPHLADPKCGTNKISRAKVSRRREGLDAPPFAPPRPRTWPIIALQATPSPPGGVARTAVLRKGQWLVLLLVYLGAAEFRPSSLGCAGSSISATYPCNLKNF